MANSKMSCTSSMKPQDEQLWFIVREHMVLPRFVQQQQTFAEIKRHGITMSDCLSMLKIRDDTSKYAFYLHTASMAAAVRLLPEESILVTYNLYCQKDYVVVIMVRGLDNPSPNPSKAASHENSLKERRKASRGALVPDVFIRPTPQHASGAIDVSTMETIADESEMITIELGEGESVILSKDYLTCWISSQRDDGRAPIDIVVQSFGSNGVMLKDRLTAAVWQRSLIRGPWADDFLPLWDSHNQIRHSREAILTELCRQIPNFGQMCENFIHDLRTYGKDNGAQKRLDGTGHGFFLGKPYFDDETRDKILTIPTRNDTLQTELDLLTVKRSEGEVCAARDLTLLYETCLDIYWDKKNGKTVALQHQMGGLTFKSPQSPLKSSKAKQLVNKTSRMLEGPFQAKRGGMGRDENEK